MRSSTSASQACGSTSLSFAVTIRLLKNAARWPPRSEPAKSHALRPRARAAQCPLRSVVRHAHASVVEEAGRRTASGRACSPSPWRRRRRAAGGPVPPASKLSRAATRGAERSRRSASRSSRGLAVHLALDGEQFVHAPHRFEGERGDDSLLLSNPPTRRGLDVGQLEEASAARGPSTPPQ